MSSGRHRGLLARAAAAFALWMPAAEAVDPLAAGRKRFTEGASPPCALCHTLADAGAAGAIGPVLDELKPDAERVAKAIRNGIGQMPSYRATLSDADIEALAEYVSKAAGRP